MFNNTINFDFIDPDWDNQILEKEIVFFENYWKKNYSKNKKIRQGKSPKKIILWPYLSF